LIIVLVITGCGAPKAPELAIFSNDPVRMTLNLSGDEYEMTGDLAASIRQAAKQRKYYEREDLPPATALAILSIGGLDFEFLGPLRQSDSDRVILYDMNDHLRKLFYAVTTEYSKNREIELQYVRKIEPDS
jgi:hypothetical protein